jgi:protein-S-isoprenylcysteine O-methyltransferase Ste14
MKGVSKLRSKLPAYEGRRLGILGIIAILSMFVGLGIQLLFDIFPRLLPTVPVLFQLEPFLPVAGSILVSATALVLVSSLWRKRDAMRARYGNLAYQKMVPRGLVGVCFVFSLAIHSYVSVRSLPAGALLNPLTGTLSQSVLPWFGVPLGLDLMFRAVLGAGLAVTAIATALRALLQFGVDYMLVVYLYFPEESEVQNHNIYSVIRHPAYFSLTLLGFGALLSRASVYSLAFFLIIVATLRIHIYVEEKELLQRFGEGYREYRKSVPGLYVHPRNLGKFFCYLLGREREPSVTSLG